MMLFQQIHTPGPWNVTTYSDHPHFQVESERGRLIASVADHHDTADKPNAHLLAAAPELFALCEDLLHQLSTDSDLDEITAVNTYQILTGRLRDVIRKVEAGRE